MISVITILKIDSTKCISWACLGVLLNCPFLPLGLLLRLINRPTMIYFRVVTNQSATATSPIKKREKV